MRCSGVCVSWTTCHETSGRAAENANKTERIKRRKTGGDQVSVGNAVRQLQRQLCRNSLSTRRATISPPAAMSPRSSLSWTFDKTVGIYMCFRTMSSSAQVSYNIRNSVISIIISLYTIVYRILLAIKYVWCYCSGFYNITYY